MATAEDGQRLQDLHRAEHANLLALHEKVKATFNAWLANLNQSNAKLDHNAIPGETEQHSVDQVPARVHSLELPVSPPSCEPTPEPQSEPISDQSCPTTTGTTEISGAPSSVDESANPSAQITIHDTDMEPSCAITPTLAIRLHLNLVNLVNLVNLASAVTLPLLFKFTGMALYPFDPGGRC